MGINSMHKEIQSIRMQLAEELMAWCNTQDLVIQTDNPHVIEFRTITAREFKSILYKHLMEIR